MEKRVFNQRKQSCQERLWEESREVSLRDSIRQGVAKLKDMRNHSNDANKDKLRRSVGTLHRYTELTTDPN